MADTGKVILRRKKSFQGHQYRRKSKPLSEQYKADLSQVLGLTVKNNSAFACNEVTGYVAFPAGCIIVVCHVRKNKQFHIFNPGNKNITCLHISSDGQNIVTGECGHLPHVRVFSLSERCQIASFQEHKFGVSCVAFTQNSQYIVSIGYQYDNVINVWNWKKNVLVASNKVSVKIRAVAFAECNSYFVTVGNRHVKFWYIENSIVPDTETLPLKGRSAILGPIRNHTFYDVACGVGSDSRCTYTLTKSATLCQFNEKRTIENSIQLQANAAYCISVVTGMVVCGCDEGKVLIHSSTDLQLLCNINSDDQVSRFVDVIGIGMDSKNMWLHCVHANHTVTVWDLIDFNCPSNISSSNFHAECVWDIKALPSSASSTCDTGHLFYTCSNDATLKTWNLTNNGCECIKNTEVEAGSSSDTSSTKKATLTGVRAICISENTQQLAVGDRNGKIHVYQLDGTELKKLASVEMHASDILSLSYNTSDNMLVSSSRDRLIYVLDSNHSPTYTINDHSAAVTAVKFVNLHGKLRLISCGVDKSLYFCTVTTVEGKVEITRDQHIVEKYAMHDMAIVSDSVLVACGANIMEYNIKVGKQSRIIRGCESTIMRISINDENTIIGVSCADKFIYILNYLSGELLLELGGHSEICTACKFISNYNNETHLITASADSCIFLWKLSRFSKITDTSSSVPTRISLNSDVDENVIDLNGNATVYFGDPDDSPPNINLSVNGGEVTEGDDVIAGDRVPEGDGVTGVGDVIDSIVDGENVQIDLDTSLPTWLTGQRDKIVKTKVPAGKWANRFQEQYKDVVNLDTPRTVMEWETVETTDNESDNEEMTTSEHDIIVEKKEVSNISQIPLGIHDSPSSNNAAVIDESIDMNSDQSTFNSHKENSHPMMVEELNPHDADCSNTPVMLGDYCILEPEAQNCTESETHVPSQQHEAQYCTESEAQKHVQIQQHEARYFTELEAQKAIPPAFANFIKNLPKKKPNTLALKRSYISDACDEKEKNSVTFPNAGDLTNSCHKDESKKELTDQSESDSDNASISCENVVSNLISAYNEAESMYHKLSASDDRAEDCKHAEALLTNSFRSIQERLSHLQLDNFSKQHAENNIANLPPVVSLLREYSDKLFTMVTEELKKKNVIKD